jgi:hypothetical protein
MRARAVEQKGDVGWIGAVAAQQPALAEQPQIARPRHRLPRCLRLGVRRVVLRRPGCHRLATGNRRAGNRAVARLGCQRIQPGQQPLDLRGLEPRQPEVELAHLLQLRELPREQRLVPAGVQRDAIVRKPVRRLLRLGQALAHDHRHRRQIEGFGGFQPAMPGDHLAVLVHQDRRDEAELDDRGRDLRHLLGRMRARVRGVMRPVRGGACVEAAQFDSMPCSGGGGGDGTASAWAGGASRASGAAVVGIAERSGSVLDWVEIDRALAGISASAKGERGWSPLALFRALLLASWHELSDVTLAEALDERAGFRRFCGFAAHEPTPERTALGEGSDGADGHAGRRDADPVRQHLPGRRSALGRAPAPQADPRLQGACGDRRGRGTDPQRRGHHRKCA